MEHQAPMSRQMGMHMRTNKLRVRTRAHAHARTHVHTQTHVYNLMRMHQQMRHHASKHILGTHATTCTPSRTLAHSHSRPNRYKDVQLTNGDFLNISTRDGPMFPLSGASAIRTIRPTAPGTHARANVARAPRMPMHMPSRTVARPCIHQHPAARVRPVRKRTKRFAPTRGAARTAAFPTCARCCDGCALARQTLAPCEERWRRRWRRRR